MNLKILFLLLGYYAMIIILLAVPGTPFSAVDYNASINNSALGSDETDVGGLFSTGVKLDRFFLLVGFSIGLPSTVPTVIAYAFILWQSVITMFSAGWLISSFWNG